MVSAPRWCAPRSGCRKSSALMGIVWIPGGRTNTTEHTAHQGRPDSGVYMRRCPQQQTQQARNLNFNARRRRRRDAVCITRFLCVFVIVCVVCVCVVSMVCAFSGPLSAEHSLHIAMRPFRSALKSGTSVRIYTPNATQRNATTAHEGWL